MGGFQNPFFVNSWEPYHDDSRRSKDPSQCKVSSATEVF